jgi:glycine/D-amino acid oxidase-like deaminating enzyme
LREPAVGDRSFHVVIVGGGLVGAALAYGMRALGRRLAVLDEGDVALRAARGNFGLIWVQGKGLGMPAYGAWTQRSAAAWPAFAADLAKTTGIDVALRQHGGLHLCLTREELDARTARIDQLLAQPGFPRYSIDVLDRAGVRARIGAAGDIAGGTWCAQDGECNPLRLLRALHAGFVAAGGALLCDHAADRIEPVQGGFVVHTAHGTIACERVVLAAGLGNARLAPMVGLVAPVSPNQGQVLVTERVPRFLDVATGTVRQTDEGTVLIGDAHQDAGFDTTQDTGVMAAMAARAVQAFPSLRHVRVVRAWSALRVMSPDGFPIYAESRECPGAWVVACHSGVTLSAAHACVLAPAIRAGKLPSEYAPFGPDRFDVRAAA